MPRKCLCGEVIPWDESYGPASQMKLKWYESGKGFGTPDVRKQFYLCREHTNLVVKMMEEWNAQSS